MRKLWPRSLAGQMALLIGLALFVAQLGNFALILNEREKLSLVQNQGPAITRFAGTAADLAQAAPEFRQAVIDDASHRGARFALRPASNISESARDRAIEAQLAKALADAGVAQRAVRATIADVPARGDGRPPSRMLTLAMERADGSWLVGRLWVPGRDFVLPIRLGAATLLLYLLVVGASLLIAVRIARPLRALTVAARNFKGRGEPVVIAPAGPADIALAIEAFNAMNARVLALLDEKDRILGAIGHDLRTPLASLRLRVEGLEDDEERTRAAATIEEMTTMLEDILVLARTGRAREEMKRTDLGALVDAIAEDYRALGRDVAAEPGPRAVASVQPVLLRRAIRNLVDNALAYAGSAALSVRPAGGAIEIVVRDSGPGIPPDRIAEVMEPFARLEGSRSRATGGAGLGLAIARGIAESHGGTLRLAPVEPHGLEAVLALPA